MPEGQKPGMGWLCYRFLGEWSERDLGDDQDGFFLV